MKIVQAGLYLYPLTPNKKRNAGVSYTWVTKVYKIIRHGSTGGGGGGGGAWVHSPAPGTKSMGLII